MKHFASVGLTASVALIISWKQRPAWMERFSMSFFLYLENLNSFSSSEPKSHVHASQDKLARLCRKRSCKKKLQTPEIDTGNRNGLPASSHRESDRCEKSNELFHCYWL